jgi:phosphoribosyl 1,2-cyclic phosphodiesterase
LGFKIEPFPVPHDARETIALIIKAGDGCLGVLTDTGMVTKHTINVLKKVGALVIEFNYDENLLNESKYPEALKKRISSKYGHLSNTSAINLIRSLESEYQKVIVAAHLSTNNNSESIVNGLLDKLSNESRVSTFIASQSSGTPWIHIN